MFDTAGDDRPDIPPLACALPAAAQGRRKEDIGRTVLAGVGRIEELPDGYALRFPGEPERAAALLRFILDERECCPFFTFALIFEPAGGPIWLHLRGPEGVKAFLDGMLDLDATPPRP